MKYILINDIVRTEFEKEHQLPFGYKHCIIRDSVEEIIDIFNSIKVPKSHGYIIESYDAGFRETVYYLS